MTVARSDRVFQRGQTQWIVIVIRADVANKLLTVWTNGRKGTPVDMTDTVGNWAVIATEGAITEAPYLLNRNLNGAPHSSLYLAGGVGDILLFNSPKVDADVAAVNRYFHKKYNLKPKCFSLSAVTQPVTTLPASAYDFYPIMLKVAADKVLMLFGRGSDRTLGAAQRDAMLSVYTPSTDSWSAPSTIITDGDDWLPTAIGMIGTDILVKSDIRAVS